MPDAHPDPESRRDLADLERLVSEAEQAVRDGAYVAVGLGVLAFQRAQVRRRELLELLDEQRRSVASKLGSDADAGLADLNKRVGQVTNELAKQLEGVGKSLNDNVGATRAQLVDLARTVDRQVAPARRQLDQQIDALEERLPTQARDALRAARAAVAVPERRIRAAVGLD